MKCYNNIIIILPLEGLEINFPWSFEKWQVQMRYQMVIFRTGIILINSN